MRRSCSDLIRNKAVFIDRDGTINVDIHYLDNPYDFSLYPGVGEGLKRLKDAGYKIIVITNQSGIGRGYFSEDDLVRIHERMMRDLARYNVVIDAIYYCPHRPEENCSCRKPRIGMFRSAITDHLIDPSGSFMVGDKILDIESGHHAGVKTILVPEPHERAKLLASRNVWTAEPDFLAKDITDAVNWILTAHG